MMIPVFEPTLTENDIDQVLLALRRGEISGTFGQFIPRFEEEFAAYVGCRFGIACSSGTAALQLAARAANLEPGDEVLVSASTNIASALGAYYTGATIVPIDSEDSTWNLDLDRVADLITPRTRAIIPVHLFGHPVDMDRLMDLVAGREITVIEDAAEAHGATCRGRKAGSFGQMSCFSFYANKLITTGEGGMVLTNDEALATRVRDLRNLAFGQPRFLHLEAGYNFRMTGMQAALGLSQLDSLEKFIEQKRALAASYFRNLSPLADDLHLPNEASWARHVYWMFGVRVRASKGRTRDGLAEHLRKRGVDTRTFFCPLNLQPFLAAQSPRSALPCPVAEQMWHDGLYLPSSCRLTEGEIQTICDAVSEFFT